LEEVITVKDSDNELKLLINKNYGEEYAAPNWIILFITL